MPDLEGARVQVERALEIGEATLARKHPTQPTQLTQPTHPTVAVWRGNLGCVLRLLGT